MQTTYRAKRLGSNFNIKDRISFENQHNVVYHAKCPNRRCKSHYNGQTKCRIGKRASQHSKEDKQSHLYKHATRTRHKKVDIRSFRIVGRGYRSDFTRKISESLFIKKLKPDLNIQKDSYKLLLFNQTVSSKSDVRYRYHDSDTIMASLYLTVNVFVLYFIALTTDHGVGLKYQNSQL